MHRAVLLQEVLENLKPAPGKKILDCTVGGGGHSRFILELITPGGKLIGIDQDSSALKTASERLKGFEKETVLIKGNFRDAKSILTKQGLGKVDGVLYDLGLSSLQLEEGERGFSIKLNAPLDMRMDRGQKINAGNLVNKISEPDLKGILKSLGEERQAGRIARAIVSRRPIMTTHQLAETVLRAIPAKRRSARIHPATRTFQALRIAVNDELGALNEALDNLPGIVKEGGRICIISFHSLEDRIVKHRFKAYKKANILNIVTKKPITPEREEILINPRSRSAKLRVAERI
ncbi:MAG: 16S rRNA (cytosine(1402)-N(4))-methyltransferase RsmH [Candidatus Omnitrophica bacterium]|nr:16S rRNA (cytosine(1402)-N(4))-methyltransferase RsmH [Candidatus Omnitrophota bacterium]